jgi:DUF971 family protein
MASHPLPSDVKLHAKSNTLELIYDGQSFEMTAEYLRVYSPSAEVRGHGIGNAVLQTGKQFVGIKEIQPAGQYAMKIIFDDGHDSGIYTWDYLYELTHKKSEKWESYLKKLEQEGGSRNDGLIARS